VNVEMGLEIKYNKGVFLDVSEIDFYLKPIVVDETSPKNSRS
jgi:hypothetical protein